jgi:hypothetical protein
LGSIAYAGKGKTKAFTFTNRSTCYIFAATAPRQKGIKIGSSGWRQERNVFSSSVRREYYAQRELSRNCLSNRLEHQL